MSPAAQTDAVSSGHRSQTSNKSFEINQASSTVDQGSGRTIPSIIDQSQQTKASSDSDRLHTAFERFARLVPDQIALDFRLDLNSQGSSSNTAWTYGELDQKATSFAAHLLKRPELPAARVVPICMDRCPELYVAILAILKIGCAWCPIDPSFPTRRRQSLIARTGASIVLTTQRNLDGFPNNVTSLDITQVELDRVGHCESTAPTADDMAYLIWTSGTTGGG
ncbi:MAG: putative NRPS-like protein biosynthetic cluster [Ramalina farinacea]|uniref:NRPS-like protein biosynthetic cluster n=1 Tax=Ramalina farinacea TaxID=258253 RepID=A0AA43QLF8_9LECA|nr:putative NRPS-like protein biosynthetic cluster [Ramalina farinacea]